MQKWVGRRGTRALARTALALALAGALAGCGGKQAPAQPAGRGAPREQALAAKTSAAYDASPAGGPAVVAAAPAAPAPSQESQTAQPAERRAAVLPPSGTRLTQQKIIKNAELSIEVKDVAEAIDQVTRAADTMFGVVTDSQLAGGDAAPGKGERRATLTVRVPGDHFNEFLVRVQEFGKLLHHRVYTEDVSGQFVDLEARQQSALRHEQRLLDIMARASTVDELLKLENELSRVRGEIESITGRLNLLKDRVEFSTFRLTLIEAAAARPADPKPKTVWQQAIEAFLAGAKALGEFAASLIVFAFGVAPAAFAVGVMALLLWPLARRLRGPGQRLAPAGPTGTKAPAPGLDPQPGDR